MAEEQINGVEKPPEEFKWPFVYKLAKPIEVFGDTHTELKLREPTVADFLKFGVLDGELNGEKTIEMIAHLSNNTPQTLRAFPGLDMMRLSMQLTRFFGQAVR